MARIAGNQQNGERNPTDDYPTAPGWTRVLNEFLPTDVDIWEPAAGTGMMADELMRLGHRVIATDIQHTGEDFLAETTLRAPFVVTNPPYRLALEFALHALSLQPDCLALLVGWHLLGGARRSRALWEAHPPTFVVMIPERMRVDGKPSQFNHAWVVWNRWDDSPTGLVWRHAVSE